MDMDSLMVGSLKSHNGFIFRSEMNDKAMRDIMLLGGGNGNTLKLNMTVDAYGEGGGKRATTSISPPQQKQKQKHD